MYDKDFAELVKIAAEKLKEDTVYKMLTRSEDYQKESDERDKAERNYEQLDLTMEQRKVCDVFLDYRDRQSLEYSDYSYLTNSSCGLSHAAPYSHFSNKEELLQEMQLHITKKFTEVLENTVSQYRGTPIFLLEFGKAYISFFISHPQYFNFLFQQGNIQIDLIVVEKVIISPLRFTKNRC